MKKISKCMSLTLAGGLALALPAWAQGPRVMPRINQVEGVYVSTQLLLNPCLDVQTLGVDLDDDLRKTVAEARKTVPPGVCEVPARAAKLFQARFLQYASLASVNDPWNLDATVDAQNQALARCKTSECVDRALDAAIAALMPVYLGDRSAWPRGRGLCAADPVDAPVVTALAPLGARARKEIASDCGGESVTAQTCQGPHGTLLFVSCEMSGNQVNAPQWIYRFDKARRIPVIAVADGPVGIMESRCNGMPDLMTVARINAGEHQKSYYRYDGRQYQSVYDYTEMSVGSDDNGNELAIAQGGPQTRVVCR